MLGDAIAFEPSSLNRLPKKGNESAHSETWHCAYLSGRVERARTTVYETLSTWRLGGSGVTSREQSFFGQVSRAGEINVIAVGVGEEDFPGEVADLRFVPGIDPARGGFTVDGEGVAALEVEGCTVAKDAIGGHLLAARFDSFLKHESGAAEGHLTPAQVAIRNPAVLDREAKPVEVEGERAFHAGDP